MGKRKSDKIIKKKDFANERKKKTRVINNNKNTTFQPLEGSQILLISQVE